LQSLDFSFQLSDIWLLQELGNQVALIRQTANNVFTAIGKTIEYKIGTMIEIPRAALVADEVGVFTKLP